MAAGGTLNIEQRNPQTSACFLNTWGTVTTTSSDVTQTSVATEPTAVALANEFWNNREYLVRYSHDPQHDYYDGDDTRLGNYGNRFENPVTRTFSYSFMPTTTSNFFTIVAVSTGSIAINGGIYAASPDVGTLVDAPATLTYVGDAANPTSDGVGNNGFGISVSTKVYSGNLASIRTNSVSTYSMGENDGTWIWSYIIPGKWKFVNIQPNFNLTTDGYTTAAYQQTVQAGDMHFVLYEGQGNGYRAADPMFLVGDDIVTNPNYPELYGPWDYNNPRAKLMTVDKWWYNNSGAEVWVNTSSVGGGISYIDLGLGHNLNSFTPRIGAILRNY